MKHLACMLLLFCMALTVDALGEGVPETNFVAKGQLEVLASAPKWWHIKLPPKTGDVTFGQKVKVLDRKSHNTLLGQQEWFYIEVPPVSNGQLPMTGWVLGRNDGQMLLQPASP